MTNEIGLKLNHHMMEDRGKYSGRTLGAFRRGKSVCWIPGAVIDVWTKCARMEMATGVPWPHALFIQTIGDGSYAGIFCPQCRMEVKLQTSTSTSGKKTPPSQLSLF